MGLQRATAALGLVALTACGGGGGSPTGGGGVPPVSSPSPSGWPAGTTPQLVNGQTGEAVQGPVVVAGTTVQSGQRLAEAAAVGATVDVVVPGFLPRQTLARTGETRLVLWPDTPELPGDYTRTLVYTSSSTGADPGTLEAMQRLPTRVRSVAVVPSAAILADPDAMEAHRAAVDVINGATAPLGLTYLLGGAADFSVTETVSSSAGACADQTTRAFTTWWLSGTNEITRAEITFCREAIARTSGTIAHELGHTFGLRHSPDARDMMYAYARSTRSTGPTAREALTMSLMRARRSGTEWPDNDRAATAAAAVRVVTVVD